jgi:hypothetical protein
MAALCSGVSRDALERQLSGTSLPLLAATRRHPVRTATAVPAHETLHRTAREMSPTPEPGYRLALFTHRSRKMHSSACLAVVRRTARDCE